MSSFMVIIFSLFLSQNLLANPQEGIPGDELPKRMRTGFVTQPSAIIDDLEYAYIQRVKAKLSQTIRREVPNELVLRSGFIAGDQYAFEMAGCYIRLGSSLRPYNLVTRSGNLAATSFLNSGRMYALIAQQVNDIEERVDSLTSAAQCYYWAFCNETRPLRKKLLEIWRQLILKELALMPIY
ncbi:MAG: hypothetical protein K2Q34_03525 [Alphaproteobacteria bacterium]|nr:hypothetical protein [Alphaproteobacteria bacterium]